MKVKGRITFKGGAGSGNFGHSGRPGKVGGSGGGSGLISGGSSQGFTKSGSDYKKTTGDVTTYVVKRSPADAVAMGLPSDDPSREYGFWDVFSTHPNKPDSNIGSEIWSDKPGGLERALNAAASLHDRVVANPPKAPKVVGRRTPRTPLYD